MNEYPYSGLVLRNSHHSSQSDIHILYEGITSFYIKYFFELCSSNTGKIAKGHTFPITITENWDLVSKQI